jgi:hypothetical protein
MENQQAIIEKFVALSASDKLIVGKDFASIDYVENGIGAIISEVSAPMIEKQVGQVLDSNKRLLLQGLITSASLYLYDYAKGITEGNWMNYVKKGFRAEAGIYVYKSMTRK